MTIVSVVPGRIVVSVLFFSSKKCMRRVDGLKSICPLTTLHSLLPTVTVLNMFSSNHSEIVIAVLIFPSPDFPFLSKSRVNAILYASLRQKKKGCRVKGDGVTSLWKKMERVFDIPKEINGTKHPFPCPSKLFWRAQDRAATDTLLEKWIEVGRKFTPHSPWCPFEQS